ncbi:MAG: nucleotidyltransferase [Desulfurococcaceae archaeon]
MFFTIRDLADVLKKFFDKKIDFVIIGDTAIQLYMNKNVFENDVDLFILEPGIVGYEDLYIEIANENGWSYGTTEVGTPRLVAGTSNGEIVVELYENMLDFNIPEQILKDASIVNIEGIEVKILKPEQYLVLKAKQGVDLDKLKRIVKQLNSIDRKLIKKTLNYIDENERKVIETRLVEAGLEI